ncbi:MAG: DUF4340 domain-containing protein [Oscillospiraceae bacterium]|nr:DUF4340 domain-containing protein [Oscillospiraceae bacterium]
MSNKKFIINIIIVVVVIGLLAGAIWFLSQPEENNDGPDVPVSENITIYSINPADMISADVTNKYGSYSLHRTDRGWSLDGFDGMDLDVNMLDALTNTFSNVASSQLVDEDPENTGDYGLYQPETVITIGTSSGSRTFYIGNETPDGKNYYFNTDDSKSVYVLAGYVADVAFLTARDYVNLGSTFAADDVTRVRIVQRSGSALTVTMDPNGARDQYGLISYWDISEPEERSASNSDVVTMLTTPVAELESTASGIYTDTAENRTMTGLDNIEFTVEVMADDKDITYYISPAADEYRYITRADSGYILRVDREAADFAYTPMEAVAERYLAMIDIAAVSSVDMAYRDETLHFTVIDGAGENAAFYVGDEELSAERFREFYQKIVALPVSGVTDDEPAEDIFGSVSYNLISGDRLKLEFAPYSERSYGVYINGRRQYSMLKKNVDDLFDLMREF